MGLQPFMCRRPTGVGQGVNPRRCRKVAATSHRIDSGVGRVSAARLAGGRASDPWRQFEPRPSVLRRQTDPGDRWLPRQRRRSPEFENDLCRVGMPGFGPGAAVRAAIERITDLPALARSPCTVRVASTRGVAGRVGN
jgi:hypothetical protein